MRFRTSNKGMSPCPTCSSAESGLVVVEIEEERRADSSLLLVLDWVKEATTAARPPEGHFGKFFDSSI